MNERYNNLYINSLNEEFYNRTCGYWYTVTNGASPHKGFGTREKLENWLTDLGLIATEPIPDQGTPGSQRIIGEYARITTMNYLEFYGVASIFERRTMDNGQWTTGKIAEDETGVRTLYVLNCNCKDRDIFDWRECTNEYM